VNESLTRSVWDRAKRRCEYCHMPAAAYASSLHVDHIIARQHGGETGLENLALACMHCNQRKGPNIAGRNPETGEIIHLFHPRKDAWNDHFEPYPQAR
jgi:5-methylcytosine-specific restriction endonuclease McrA